MHWSTVLSALLGSTIPAVVGSVVMLRLKKASMRLWNTLREILQMLFWNSYLRSLSAEGGECGENIRRQLDFEIPEYLPRIQEDINESLDPNYKSHDKNYRRTILEFLSKKTSEGTAIAS